MRHLFFTIPRNRAHEAVGAIACRKRSPKVGAAALINLLADDDALSTRPSAKNSFLRSASPEWLRPPCSLHDPPLRRRSLRSSCTLTARQRTTLYPGFCLKTVIVGIFGTGSVVAGTDSISTSTAKLIEPYSTITRRYEASCPGNKTQKTSLSRALTLSLR